jgi:hypothetical protein
MIKEAEKKAGQALAGARSGRHQMFRRRLPWIVLVLGGTTFLILGAWQRSPWPSGSLGSQIQPPVEAPRRSGPTITLETLGSSGQYGPLGCSREITLAEPHDRPLLSDTVNVYLDEFHTRLTPLLRRRSPLADALIPLLADDGGEENVERLLALPQRRAPGFDYAVGALLTRSVRAFRQGRPDESRRWAEAAIAADGSVAAAHVWHAVLLEHTDDPASVVQALRRALNLDGQDPAVALALGLHLARTADAAGAAEALALYLEVHPTDRAVAQLGGRLRLQAELQEGFRRYERAGLTVIATPTMAAPEAWALHELLSQGLTDAARLLGQSRRPELTAVVYTNREDLQATTCSTPWTGAVFDGTLRLALEGEQRPAHWEAVVRHETVHAQLHHDAPNGPTWLHEGLAQYLAEQRPRALWETYERMARTGTFIPLASMAGSFMVIDDNEDALVAYHQSLAMIDLLVQNHGSQVIRRAVTLLQNGTSPENLLHELTTPPLTGADLLEYVRSQLKAENERHRLPR